MPASRGILAPAGAITSAKLRWTRRAGNVIVGGKSDAATRRSAAVKLCRFNDDRLGLVEGDQVADVTGAIEVIPPARWPSAPEAARSVLFSPIRIGPVESRTR